MESLQHHSPNNSTDSLSFLPQGFAVCHGAAEVFARSRCIHRVLCDRCILTDKDVVSETNLGVRVALAVDVEMDLVSAFSKIGAAYTLFHGEQPEAVRGEAIEVPSALSVVIVRVEVRDKNDPDDVGVAEIVFNGITIDGEVPSDFPQLDLLSGFPQNVAEEALSRLDETFANIPISQTIARIGQEPGRDIPYLNHSAGTKGAWGGPDPAHSAYETPAPER